MELTIEMLETALKRWHDNLFPDTKHAEFLRDTQVAKGKVAMIEQILWWIDAVRSGEVNLEPVPEQTLNPYPFLH